MIYRRIMPLFVILLIQCPSISHSLTVTTHERINRDIAPMAVQGFSLDSYLKNNLAFPYGRNEQLRADTVQGWMEVGGKQEDEPSWCIPYISRSVNHFHNPLNDNGFSGFVVDGFLAGDSAVRWAQYPIGAQSSSFMTYLCGDYSWFDVRNYFYRALTSQINSEKEEYFAKTFQGVGQLMHLVQDMSVPEHTRNQAHILPAYEGWVEENLDMPVYGNSLNNPFFPNDILFRTQSVFDNASVIIANLFDTNQYDGTNPEITIYNNVGLSEYSNANFISKDTVFSSQFPYPAYSNMYSYKDPTSNKPYLSKIGAGDNIVHFVATKEYYPKLPPAYKASDLTLDKKVYADYAEKLLPRAIGYSAALMKYFFRGSLEISRPEENIYSVIDGSVSQSFGKIKAKVRNNTPSEEAGNGTLFAIAKYITRNDYLPDLSHDPPNQPLPEVNYSYSVSAPVTIDNSIEALRLKADNPNSYLFDFSASPVPAGVTDLTLMVVFKGTLGYEPDSAIAVGSNDLMEPAHHVYFNLTDMFAINGHLWTAQQIRDNTSLLSQVGTAYIDPFPMSVAVSYVNQAPPMPITYPEIDIAAADLSPGNHFELIVLVDNNNYIRVTEADSIDPGIDTRYTGYIGFRNQSYGGAWTSTPGQLLFFRHDAAGNPVRTNFYTGWLRCTPYEGGYCPYPENEATVPLPGLSPVPVQILGDFGL